MRDCEEQCTVHQYRAREKNPNNSRFAGQYFVTCPVHGRMGGDPKNRDAKLQSWIKDKAKLDGAAKVPVERSAPSDTVAAPSKPRKKKSKSAAVPAAPAAAATKDEPPPPPAVSRKSWLGGW